MRDTRRVLEHGCLVALASVAAFAACSCHDFYVGEDEPDASGAEPDASGAEPRSPCSSPSAARVFCDDFDTGALGATWDQVDPELMTLDSSTFASPGRSLRVLVPQPSTGDFASKLVKSFTFAAGMNNLVLHVALKVARPNPILPFGVFCGNDGYAIAFNLGSESFVSELGSRVAYTTHVTKASFPIGQWQDLELRIRRDAGTVAMKANGETVLAESALQGKSELASDSCRLVLGVYFAVAGTTWDANFDNVAVTTF